jgi:membrane-bound serine protease (ClpP class)
VLRLRTVGRPGVGTITAMSISLPAVRRALALSVLALLVLALTASFATAQTEADDPDGRIGDDSGTQVVEVLPLRAGLIDPPVTSQILDVLEIAEDQGSQLVVLQYSSPGGVSVDLDTVIDSMEASEIPIAVLVGPLGVGAEAAGAAGLLWLAADIRAISADASVGPLDPVDLAALDGDYPLLERTTGFVEAAGGDTDLAERLVNTAVPADELVEGGVVTLAAQGLEPLLIELDGTTIATAAGETTLRIRANEVELRFHSLGLVRRVLHAATTAPFIYLLLVVGLGALLFEVFQPGFGVAGMAGLLTVAISAFGLTVLPVTWWAVALVVLGLLLYAVDTALAGFGPVTLAATVAFVVGSLWFYASEALALNAWLVGATALTVFVFFVFVMTTVLRAQAGPEGVAVDDLVGRPGIVRSMLNPEGHVYIDGALWRARWTGDTKRAKVGTPVMVHDVDGAVVLVRAFDPERTAADRDRDGAGVAREA